MKNFKYLFVFSLSFNLLNNTHAVFVDGMHLEHVHEETSSAPRTTLVLKTERKKGDEPNLKVSWLRLKKKTSKGAALHTTDSLPTKAPAQGTRLKRATSVRDTTKDKTDALNGSRLQVSTDPIPRKKEGRKGHRRTRAVSSARTNPIHKQQPLGMRQELEAARSTGHKWSLADFTAGSDATLRGIDLSLAKLSAEKDEPKQSSSPSMVPLFPSQDLVDLGGNNGTITFTHHGALQRQHFKGMKVNNYIEVLFPELCQFKVYPADPESPVVLYSGHFDPSHSKFDVKFRNCGKVQISAAEEKK